LFHGERALRCLVLRLSVELSVADAFCIFAVSDKLTAVERQLSDVRVLLKRSSHTALSVCGAAATDECQRDHHEHTAIQGLSPQPRHESSGAGCA
jgi:hypothetical protein